MSDKIVKVPRPQPKPAEPEANRPPLFREVQVRELATAKLTKGGSVAILEAPSIGLKITSLIPGGGGDRLVYYQVDEIVYGGEEGQEAAVGALVELGRIRKD